MSTSRRAVLAACVVLVAMLAGHPGVPLFHDGVAHATGEDIQVHLDASDAPRALYHGTIVITAKPGPLTLVYPKWIPGEHGPTGPITDFVGLEFSAGGKPIAWRRDEVDMYAFHVTVPEGADRVEVRFSFLGVAQAGTFTSGVSSTANLAVLSWNQTVLYPAGARSDDVVVRASVTLPAGWRVGTSMLSKPSGTNTLAFEPVSLTTLVDSPVLIGKYFRSVPLDDGERPVVLDIAADSPAALEITPEITQQMQQLVREADAMFGARHFDRYHFLLTLSDHVAHFGLEHHQSNDTRLPERTLLDDDLAKRGLPVLSHEYAHSWNAKYRRPEGLATPSYQDPMRGELLWVYEGLTTYLGEVLSARCGLWTPEYYREDLAATAAYYDHMRGRDWRPLDDTCVAAQIQYGSPGAWRMTRRGVDFYDEGWMMWLDVDTRIRELTKGKRSLDDFCRSFLGGESGSPRVVTYTFDDVVAALNAVAPFDWAGYFNDTIMKVTAHPPLGGIERGGWRLVYNDTGNLSLEVKNATDDEGFVDATYSIGLRMNADGGVTDIVPDSPAFEAGIGAGMTVVAVNSRRFSADVFEDALKASASSKDPIVLLVENREFFTFCAVDYHDGLRIPHLERDAKVPDLLAKHIAPRAKAGKK